MIPELMESLTCDICQKPIQKDEAGQTTAHTVICGPCLTRLLNEPATGWTIVGASTFGSVDEELGNRFLNVLNS